MKFWDASAVLPLLAIQPSRPRMRELPREDPQVLTWWGTALEDTSALTRREREQLLTPDEVTRALMSVQALAASWHEIVLSDPGRRTAEQRLRTHPLRATDILQLAATLVAANHDPATLKIVCLDNRLTGAARREGFTVIDR